MTTPIMQYIGARYVPLIYTNTQDGTANWESNVTYEPLTIVTYLGDSYTSKETVPPSIGNPQENSSYWVLTGSFNQQLEAIRIQVEHLSEQVSEIEADVTAQIQFNYSSIWESLDIMCTANENEISIKQREKTLEIINAYDSRVNISVSGTVLTITTEV